MDYTQSNSFVTDAGTAQRMHLAGQAVPTAVSDNDMNMLVWELMEIQKAGGQVAAPFDKATPATYQKLLTALRAAGVFSTAGALDNTTKAATTAFVRAELLSLGNAAYAAIFGNSKTASGYQRLPGGLIVQWGIISVSVGGGFTWTYPITFPNAALQAYASVYAATVGDVVLRTAQPVSPLSASSAQFAASVNGAAVASNTGFSLLAIGH